MGYYANVSVARSQVHCRRPFLIFWPSQHLRSHSHVLLLYDGCHGTSLSKVPLVETTLDPLQMLQFVAIMIHGFQLVFYDDCDFPWQFAYYIVSMLCSSLDYSHNFISTTTSRRLIKSPWWKMPTQISKRLKKFI